MYNMGWSYTYIFLYIIVYISHSTKAKNFKEFQGFKIPCSDTSPECLQQSLQAILPEFIRGFPELGISSLDPFKVDSLVLVLPGKITVDFKEASTRGLRKCIVDYVRQTEGTTFNIQLGCNLISKGKYRSTGHLFMFPIDGEGHSTIISRNLKIRWTIQLSSTKKADGENYLQIDNIKTSHSFEGRVTYNITNLIKGNSDMSTVVLDFMNQNWRMVAEEFGSPIINYCINSVLNNLQMLLKAIPINNLIIT